MKTTRLSAPRAASAIAVAWIMIGCMFWGVDNAHGQTAPRSNLSPGLQEVVKLAQAHMGDGVILAYIKNSGTLYTLSADDILYLKDQGVSQNVITALLQSQPAGNPNVVPQSSPATEPPPVDAGTANPPPANPSGGNPTAGAPASGLNTGLIAYYPFDGNANDASGNGHDATLMNSPSFVKGVTGSAIYLTGGSGYFGAGGQYVTLPYIPLINYPAFTITLWAKIDGSTTRDAGQSLISLGATHLPDGRGYIAINYSLGGQGQVDFNSGGPASDISVSPFPSGCLGNWAHYALVYDNGTLTGFINGQAVATKTGVTAGESATTAGLGIDWFPDTPGGVSTRFIGAIDEVRVYNRALSSSEVAELANAEGQVGATPPPAPAPEPAVNFDYFQQQLSPYGRWVDVPGYDHPCWQPSELPDGWRPYYDSGHWVYSDAGLYWQSDYPWGAIPFHYGRWAWVGGYGWIWAPGYEYAPAWVYWRHCDGYLGWAPLPYGAVWVAGGWWEYHGVRVVDCDFGFGPRYFVFVDHRHFWEHDYRPFVLRGVERDRIYRISVVNRVRMDEHGSFVHEGLEREHLERLTGRRVEEVRHEELRNREHEALRVDHQRVMEHGGHAPAVAKTEQHGQPEKHGQPEQRGQAEQHVQPQQPRQVQQQASPEQHAQPQSQGQGQQHVQPQQQGPSQQQARPEQHGKPEDKGKPEEKGKDDQKNQNQSKGNTNQHFAQLKGSAGS